MDHYNEGCGEVKGIEQLALGMLAQIIGAPVGLTKHHIDNVPEGPSKVCIVYGPLVGIGLLCGCYLVKLNLILCKDVKAEAKSENEDTHDDHKVEDINEDLLDDVYQPGKLVDQRKEVSKPYKLAGDINDLAVSYLFYFKFIIYPFMFRPKKKVWVLNEDDDARHNQD